MIGGSPAALVRAVASYGLPSTAVLGPAPADEHGWLELVAEAERQRVLGLLVAAVQDGALDAPEAARRHLWDVHEQWCVHDLRLERELQRATRLLDEAAIPHLVVKGPAVAHRWYRDPARRLFADLDLVVPSGLVHAATDVLAALGATPALPELRPGFDERFGKESLLRTAPTTSAPVGFEIDVHRTLVAGALGLTIPLDELFTDVDTVVVGGTAMPTLGAVATFLLACYQATVADVPPRVAAARDVAEIARSGELDVAAAVATATRWQARAVMAEAVRWAWDTLRLTGCPEILAWAEGYRPSARERTLLASHRTAGYVYWRQLAAVVVLPGLEPRARYLAAVLAPQAGYLDERRWSLTQHLRRAWRTLNRPVREPVVRAVRRFRRRYWMPR